LLLASARLAPSLELLELLELSVESLPRLSDASLGRRLTSGVERHDDVDIVTDRQIRGFGVGGSKSKTESKLLS
jgi:hypothetical protein